MKRSVAIAVVFCLLGSAVALAGDESPDKAKSRLTAGTFSGLALRAIGPALMSGRISDVAIDPVKPNTWYVAAGSGNLWKTINAGTTWKPAEAAATYRERDGEVRNTGRWGLRGGKGTAPGIVCLRRSI